MICIGNCPKCKSVLEFDFAGNNGYVAICAKCKELHYYCSIFGKSTIFKPTGEVIPIDVEWSMNKIA